MAKILVVDNEPDTVDLIKSILERYGFHVTTAYNGRQCLEKHKKGKHDLILLDIELPRMKGMEFLSWALEKDPEQAIIMLTGLDDPDLALECIGKGARTYLVKPVEAEFLRYALRDALAVRRLLIERNDLSGAV